MTVNWDRLKARGLRLEVGARHAPTSSIRRLSTSSLKPRASSLSPTRAFTLLELLLVLVLLGVMSAITAAKLGGMRGNQAVEQAAQQVHDQGLRCQHLAAGSGQAVRLRLDPRELTATVQMLAGDGLRNPGDGQDPRIVLGDGTETLTMTFARSDGLAKSDGLIDLLFLPDARCEPAGRLTFANRTRSASVRWHAGARPPTLELKADVEVLR